MRVRIRLAFMAGAAGLLAAVVPVAAASAASGWGIPGPFPSSGPQPPGANVTARSVHFTGFPSGTSLSGTMGTTWVHCAADNQARTFRKAAGSVLSAVMSPDQIAGCSRQPAQSIWQVSVGSPARYAGVIAFTFSQPQYGHAYTVSCAAAEGAIGCRAEAGGIQVIPLGHAASPAPPAGPPSASIVRGEVTFRGYPHGKEVFGSLATIATVCARGEGQGAFSTDPGATLDATIATDTTGTCFPKLAQSIWQLSVNGPPEGAGAAILILEQTSLSGPFTLRCGAAQGNLSCLPGGTRQIYLEPKS
jgi:hypothetical protein